MRALLTSIPPPNLILELEERMAREGRVPSSLSNLSIEEGEEEDEVEEKVYVAVGKEFKDWKENLRFVLSNTNLNHKIVFVHVHQPAIKIPTPIGYMPADQVKQQELRAFRTIEKEDMNKALKPYLDNCKAHKFTAIIKTIDNSDIAKGLLELIKQYKITNLIMGAASDKNYSKAKKEKAPKSKIAITVQQKAEPSCRISFVCKGELISIREAGQIITSTSNISRSSSSSNSSNNSLHLTHSQSMPPIQAQQLLTPSSLINQRSASVNVGSPTYSIYQSGLENIRTSSPLNQRSVSVNVGSPMYSSYHSGLENISYANSSSGSSSSNHNRYDDNSAVSDSLPTTPHDNSPLTNNNIMDDIFRKYEDALTEIDRMKRETLEESSKRYKAQLDLVHTKRQLRETESTLKTERQKREEVEENFAKQSNELAETLIELKKANEQNISLQLHIRKLQEKVQNLNCLEFSLLELKEATNNFDKKNKIGEGGYGSVYKACLRHTLVAIKILNRDSIQGDEQFYREVDVLSRVRHPHLVTLIGACLENRALIYELMPNMSLDDHLTYKNNLCPLSWQTRARIARDICSALIFLHSTKPQCIVHGDLKPENVLLDSNYVCKLSDFGICRQLNQTDASVTPYHLTEHPRGTLPYIDPEYLSSGEMTPQNDVFSFGIVLLQLVTGREARNIRGVLVEAAEQDKLGEVVDLNAGNWPFEVAKKMIHLGLWCSEPTRRKRPDLARDVFRVIEAMVKRCFSEPSAALGSTSRRGN